MRLNVFQSLMSIKMGIEMYKIRNVNTIMIFLKNTFRLRQKTILKIMLQFFS